MKALVTGATGFVGGAVARALIRAGVDVRVLARSQSDTQNLSGLPVERIEGDLLNPASLQTALAGCQQLYHVAAYYALWAKDPGIFYDINVTGTRNVLAVARLAGIQRTVYCSTIGAIGLPANGGLGTEDTPVSLSDTGVSSVPSPPLAGNPIAPIVLQYTVRWIPARRATASTLRVPVTLMS